MRNALKVIQKINSEYAKLSGRSYGNGLIDDYQLDDAEIAIVCVGSTSGTLKAMVDELTARRRKSRLAQDPNLQTLPSRRTSKCAGKRESSRCHG